MSDFPDVYYNKTQPRALKLELYQNGLGKCVDVAAVLTQLMRSFHAPPASNLRPNGQGAWYNLHNGETLSDREINRRYLLWVLEQMKETP